MPSSMDGAAGAWAQDAGGRCLCASEYLCRRVQLRTCGHVCACVSRLCRGMVCACECARQLRLCGRATQDLQVASEWKCAPVEAVNEGQGEGQRKADTWHLELGGPLCLMA
jgi:hypothetical protein